MRYVFAAFLVLFSPGCATLVEQTPIAAPDVSAIQPVRNGLTGRGHVCPIGSSIALVAEHIEMWHSPFEFWTKMVPVPLIIDVGGRPATLVHFWTDTRRDISGVQIATEGVEFERWYPLAKDIPQPGDTLWIRGYDVSRGFVGLVVPLRLLRIDVGEMTFVHDSEPHVGSSGSCILNAAGEVVGIYTHAYGINGAIPGATKYMGGGELVAGPWGEIDKRFLR